jgi:hypothetical protein
VRDGGVDGAGGVVSMVVTGNDVAQCWPTERNLKKQQKSSKNGTRK